MFVTVSFAFLVACGGDDSPAPTNANANPQANAPMQPAPGPGGTPFNPNAGGSAPQSGPPPQIEEGPRGGEPPMTARQPGMTNAGQPLTDGSGEATEGQVAAAIQQHIRQEIQAMGGTFKVHDPETESDLVLDFVEMKMPINKVEGSGYFGYADFRVSDGEADQLYEMGFWVRASGGHIMVTRQRLTREPVKDDDAWKQEVLYTNDAEWPDLLQ